MVTAGIEVPKDRVRAFTLDVECQRIDSQLCMLEKLLPEDCEYPGDDETGLG